MQFQTLRITLLLCLLIFCGQVNAQKKDKIKTESTSIERHNTYNTAIGLRAGWPSGVTIKHFMNGNTAFEGLIMFSPGYLNLTLLWEKHRQAFDTERLHWFYGFGAHLSSYRGHYPKKWDGVYYTTSYFSVGIDGILGLEYHLSEIPFTLGIDIKPTLDLINPSLGFWHGAISIRYAF